MKRSRIIFGLALLAAGSLCAYWAVSAQEGRPVFAPPPVLPKDEPTLPKLEEPKPTPKFPKETDPLPVKPQAADPSLIVPPAAYEVPRVTKPAPSLPKSDVIHAQGFDPAPKPPALPELETQLAPMPIPAPLPIVEPKRAPPSLPPPMPNVEPTKALIVDPPAKELPKPLVTPIQHPSVVPAPVEQPGAPTLEPRTKSFVPIRTSKSVSPPVAPMPAEPVTPKQVLPPPPLIGPGALASVQVPSVTIEKRGPGVLRGGEAQMYQIIVRNLGSAAAAQIRIDDELPAGVRMVNADPTPAIQGTKAIWALSALPAQHEQTIRFSLQSNTDVEVANRINVHVFSSSNPTNTTTVLRPRLDVQPMTLQVVAPNPILVGKPAVFEIRVANQSAQPLTGLVLLGDLPEGLHHPEAQQIRGEVEAAIAPGEVKTLRMPTTAVKVGRWMLAVRVTANGGLEASANAAFDVVNESTLQLRQAPTTRMFLGRDGDLRIEVANYTSKPLRNVAVADRLPDGLDFVTASDRGLFQANSRTVHWLLDELPAGTTKALIVRVHGQKAGQLQNVVQARADGLGDMNSVGIIQLEGVSDLSLRVVERDPLIEAGRETVYEIQVTNPGGATATNVQLQIQFPPGLLPKQAESDQRFTIERDRVVFEPIALLGAQRQAVFRVIAVAQPNVDRDQRVRFAVTSDQVRVPIQKEICTMVVPR